MMYKIEGQALSDIGDAIREKTGKGDPITPRDMPSEIASIKNGGTGVYTEPVTVTVGSGGTYKTINEAHTAMSQAYPVYKQGGLRCEIHILSGTTIREQITVVQQSLQWVTITADDAEVPVDSTGWTTCGLDAHDLRDGNVPFFGGENAANLPTIGCVFRLVKAGSAPAVGYFANRGSSGVILSGCGFVEFRDGVISNNESIVIMREALAKSCSRYGIHARHNGEIAARSAIITGAGECAIYADRAADIDARMADVSGSDKAILANNASRINAQSLSCYNLAGSASNGIVKAASLSIINADKIQINGVSRGVLINVVDGSTINALGATITGAEACTKYGQAPGTWTASA